MFWQSKKNPVLTMSVSKSENIIQLNLTLSRHSTKSALVPILSGMNLKCFQLGEKVQSSQKYDSSPTAMHNICNAGEQLMIGKNWKA